jgi:NNP family nitrate/nitrite transporter-like MFS transporter
MVGVLGGLGGFVSPIVFGYLKECTGIWSSCWILIACLSILSLVWMHAVVNKMNRVKVTKLGFE